MDSFLEIPPSAPAQGAPPVGAAGSEAVGPLAEPPPERDRIVVLGRRQSGKTIYLANLYARLWRATGGMTAKALSGEAHKHLMDAHGLLQSGQWPPATLGASQLEMEIDYHDCKHLLVTLDFAGETFARAFLYDQADTPPTKELLHHIDRAAAVLLLVDPSVGAGDDQQAAMEEDFGFVQAVERIRGWPGGEQVPVTVVLTKMDLYQGLLQQYGGPTGLVQHHFPALVRLLKRVVIFQVSAVQVFRDVNGQLRPAINSIPTNLENPLKHCLREIESARQKEARRNQEIQRQIRAANELQQIQRREKKQNVLLIAVICAILLIGAAMVERPRYWYVSKMAVLFTPGVVPLYWSWIPVTRLMVPSSVGRFNPAIIVPPAFEPGLPGSM